MPSQAKLGDNVQQLIGTFGQNYTIESDANGTRYKFRSDIRDVDVLVTNGVSVAETYFSNYPLDSNGEPPNDIVQAILKFSAPKTRWVAIDATQFRADYAIQSSNHEYVAFLRYLRPQPEQSIWTMTVGWASVVSSISTSTSPLSVMTPLVTQTPTAAPTATTAVAVPSATSIPRPGIDLGEQLVATVQNWADAISDPVRKIEKARPWDEHIGEGLLFFLAMVTLSTVLSTPIAWPFSWTLTTCWPQRTSPPPAAISVASF